MNEPPELPNCVALSGLTIAEGFLRRRDGQRRCRPRHLFFIDNIFLHAGGFEVRLWPDASAVGASPRWPPNGCHVERITSTKRGSITSVQAVYKAG
jgi:F0F1-type ATP synthase beta subunit